MQKTSMGPRPRGRGVYSAPHAERTELVNFNGAAPARARSRQRRIFLSSDCLTSMGPRPRGRGVTSSPTFSESKSRLQWGRARAGAES